jgi:opacity protein-like surface antigen
MANLSFHGEKAMLHKMSLVTSTLLLLCCFAVAQENGEASKVDLFAGYQFTHVAVGHGIDAHVNLNGWNAAVTGYFNRHVGITADFSGVYGNDSGINTREHPYLFGPTVRFPVGKITPYGHLLFGATHANFSSGGVSQSDNSFAWAMGGGLDVNVNRHFAVRPAQFDWLRTQFFNSTQSNVRYSAGVVVKF